MRYKTDWNYTGPEGNPGANNRNSFQQNSGVAIDVTLWVVKEYTLIPTDASMLEPASALTEVR